LLWVPIFLFVAYPLGIGHTQMNKSVESFRLQVALPERARPRAQRHRIGAGFEQFQAAEVQEEVFEKLRPGGLS
jgi:hypothetical protein